MIKRLKVLFAVLFLCGTFLTHGMYRSLGGISGTSVRTSKRLSASYKRLIHAEALTDIISEADLCFRNVSGYEILKKRVEKATKKMPHAVKGYTYQLKIAARYAQHGYEIASFEQVFQNKQLGVKREIDIVIKGTCAIECKNINWDLVLKVPSFSCTIAQQLRDQQTLVQSGVVGVPSLIFCSYHTIPDNWKVWLRENGILYHEGLIYKDDSVGEFLS